MTHDTTMQRLCDWIERGKSAQQVSARYRSAMRRECVDTDGDFRRLAAARDYGLHRAAIAKAERALTDAPDEASFRATHPAD